MKNLKKKRRYSHFDEPLDDAELASFAPTPSEVETHGFLPLLGYTKRERRIDFDADPWFIDFKDRDIRYASHRDAAIFSYYARHIGAHYEKELVERGLSQVALAYRGGIGSNIDFAYSLFREVADRKSCFVICLDISKFFDNIEHSTLKAAVAGVLGSSGLERHVFKVFRQVTDFSYVMREQIEAALGRKVRGPRICSAELFREKIVPLIQRGPGKGIAQGTALSGLFANIYMLEFDTKMSNRIAHLGGSYRRYSDDIAIVLPSCEMAPELYEEIKVALADLSLTLKDEKTTITAFTSDGSGLTRHLQELQYLGFTFDGSKILVRSASIKRFYSKMKSNIRHSIRSAKKKGIDKHNIYLRGLIRRFTHWGDDRNFVQYVYRASRKMNAPEMKRQLRKHVPVFQSYYKKWLERVYA